MALNKAFALPKQQAGGELVDVGSYAENLKGFRAYPGKTGVRLVSKTDSSETYFFQYSKPVIKAFTNEQITLDNMGHLRVQESHYTTVNDDGVEIKEMRYKLTFPQGMAGDGIDGDEMAAVITKSEIKPRTVSLAGINLVELVR
jgi:hypothetical protein